MKTFSQLVKEINEAKYEWPASLTPGTKEYKERGSKDSDGSRHKIEKEPGIVRATRKYDSESGESEEPTKNRENAAEAPAKRGRGRPPGKYGSYKKKLKESLEILESLETQEEIEEFIASLDQESFEELEAHIDEELHPNQRVLDKNKNNKLDKEDFKILRGEKKANEEVEQIDEGPHGGENYTLGNPIDKKYVYQIHRTSNDVRDYKNLGKWKHDGGTVHSLEDAKRRKDALLRGTHGVKAKIVRVPRSKLAGPKGRLPEDFEVKEEQIDELSQETLRNYHAKAGFDLQKKKEKLSAGTLTSKEHKKGQDRVKGLNRSAAKMEEVEVKEEQIDESVNRYAAFISTENK